MFERETSFVDNIKPYRPDRVLVADADARRFMADFKFLDPIYAPVFTRSVSADFMRDDDHVIGLVHRGTARAYPMWIHDYYHVVNDVIDGDPVAFFSCDRCQTGDAWIASVGGEHLVFRLGGIVSCAAAMMDEGTRTIWSHYEGVALHGPMKGTTLSRIQTFHCSWEEWRHLHPDGEVLMHPEDPFHSDGRHGHGSEESFERAGTSPWFIENTLLEPVDQSLSENRMVLAATLGRNTRIYPLDTTRSAGGVIHDELSGQPIVVWAGPGTDSFTMAAFGALVEGKQLEFECRAEQFIDVTTGTHWSADGRASEGPLAGKSLDPVHSTFIRWHAWGWSHVSNDVYQLPPAKRRAVDVARFEPALETLTRAGFKVDVLRRHVHLERPNESIDGLTLAIDGDRFALHAFDTVEAAEDFGFMRPRSLRNGHFVFESDPPDEAKFADPFNSDALPEKDIPWSTLLDETTASGIRFQLALKTMDPPPNKTDATMANVVRTLRSLGYEIELGEEVLLEGSRLSNLVMVETPRSQLRPGCRNAMFLRIREDRFILYHFRSDLEAQAYCVEQGQTLCGGRYVLRSTPREMYSMVQFRMGQRPDDEVPWSPLLEDAEFVEIFSRVGRGDVPATR